jgi:uncharacterized protein YeaO (DUF488 family)
MIHIKRVYDSASLEDGQRFLVDRLWPRGINKDTLNIKAWYKDAAPSNELRHWYGHDPDKWCEFNERYFSELDAHPQAWHPLLEAARQGDITLLFSTRELEHNNAISLRAYLNQQLKLGS